ncbi:hypothetical protein DMA11_10565 [Marinilabiliaceae bacterium JC017]|nr:hypothetical protein DMA11_10565 [Marinilabiliaceae bacterium JC017]
MQPVPSYQVVEFLDWFKHKQQRIDLNSEKLEEIAKFYLQEYQLHRPARFNMHFILEIFQICPQIGERDIFREMEHFAQCGECLHYIFRREIWRDKRFPRVRLHPLLERFINYLRERDSQLFYSFDRDFEDVDSSDEIHHQFKNWIRRNGEVLLFDFKLFIENVEKSLIKDFEIKIRRERRHLDRGIEREREDTFGEINISNLGIENESHRLADSVRYLLSDDRNLQNQELLRLYSTVFQDDFSKTLEFFNWILENYPKVNLASDIPSSKIDELIDQFCEQYSYSEIKTFKKQVEKIFRGEIEGNLLSKIRNWFNRIGNKIDYSTNPFDRYNQVNFHGVFLFPNYGSSDLIKFIDESWQDLNSLTGEWIDVYYSKEDISKRNGFDILQDFKSFSNIKFTDLPSFIVWDTSLKNAIAIPLSELDNNQILMSIQHIVQSIKDNKNLKEVATSGLNYINTQLDKKQPKQIHYFMGDSFEFNNAQNFTFVNKSTVKNSFNKIKEQFDDETAEVITQIAEIIESSKNKEAAELFDAFNEEVNKPEPKKSLLKTFWTGLTAALPLLSTTASIAEKVMKLIN